MVIKGSARGAPAELAVHLQRTDTNERANVLRLWGVASSTIAGALHELDALGAGARSRRTLYHAQINSRDDELLTPVQRQRSVERLGQELGLDGQPYVLVEHVKKGRQHFHVVWSRIDIDTMKAIPDSHNYRKHEMVARELEREFQHARVQGVHVERDGKPRPPRTPALAEMRQADRSGMTPQQAKERVTECWHRTKTGAEFVERLDQAGFVVARGDRRDFVLIDRAGEIHGLTRRVAGAKAAEIRDRMADIDADMLPTADQARDRIRRLTNVNRPEAEKGFVSAIERQRAEDIDHDRNAQAKGRPRLNHADQEISDAVWKLGRTMRGELENIVVGRPIAEQIDTRRNDAAKRPEIESPRVTGPSPEATQRLSPEPESPIRKPQLPPQTIAEAKQSPSVSLFAKVLNRVGELYRALVRTPLAPQALHDLPAETVTEKSIPERPTPTPPAQVQTPVHKPPVPKPMPRETLEGKFRREAMERGEEQRQPDMPKQPERRLERILERRPYRNPNDPQP